jgi:hypothetical protein
MTRPVEYHHECDTNAPAVRIFHGAKGEAKPAFSEQRAAIRTTDCKTASSKKSTPPRGFSKFRFAFCILLTAICLLFALAVLAQPNPPEADQP